MVICVIRIYQEDIRRIMMHIFLRKLISVPVQGIWDGVSLSTIRGKPFYGYSEKLPRFSRLSRRAWGHGGHIFVLNPRVPKGESAVERLFT